MISNAIARNVTLIQIRTDEYLSASKMIDVKIDEMSKNCITRYRELQENLTYVLKKINIMHNFANRFCILMSNHRDLIELRTESM